MKNRRIWSIAWVATALAAGWELPAALERDTWMKLNFAGSDDDRTWAAM